MRQHLRENRRAKRFGFAGIDMAFEEGEAGDHFSTFWILNEFNLRMHRNGDHF
jgi:hypothetical protein